MTRTASISPSSPPPPQTPIAYPQAPLTPNQPHEAPPPPAKGQPLSKGQTGINWQDIQDWAQNRFLSQRKIKTIFSLGIYAAVKKHQIDSLATAYLSKPILGLNLKGLSTKAKCFLCQLVAAGEEHTATLIQISSDLRNGKVSEQPANLGHLPQEYRQFFLNIAQHSNNPALKFYVDKAATTSERRDELPPAQVVQREPSPSDMDALERVPPLPIAVAEEPTAEAIRQRAVLEADYRGKYLQNPLCFLEGQPGTKPWETKFQEAGAAIKNMRERGIRTDLLEDQSIEIAKQILLEYSQPVVDSNPELRQSMSHPDGLDDQPQLPYISPIFNEVIAGLRLFWTAAGFPSEDVKKKLAIFLLEAGLPFETCELFKVELQNPRTVVQLDRICNLTQREGREEPTTRRIVQIRQNSSTETIRKTELDDFVISYSGEPSLAEAIGAGSPENPGHNFSHRERFYLLSALASEYQNNSNPDAARYFNELAKLLEQEEATRVLNSGEDKRRAAIIRSLYAVPTAVPIPIRPMASLHLNFQH